MSNHSFGLGYQQIIGDSAYPLLDGYLPETYFINWNVTGFAKQDEKSYHFIYSYDFKDFIPGSALRWNGFMVMISKSSTGEDNQETEANYVLNYAFQQPYLKGPVF